jgi:hypothetical protein
VVIRQGRTVRLQALPSGRRTPTPPELDEPDDPDEPNDPDTDQI